MALQLVTGCAQVEEWVRFDRVLSGGTLPLTIAAITSVDDDLVSITTVSTPTVTWTHPGLSAGTDGLHFQIAIGTAPGASDVVGWTPNGISTSWSATGLSLTLNATYYATVRIVDVAGVVHATTGGDGWKVVSTVSTAALYAIAPNWNSYANTITPTNACVGTEQGYFACIHGGERKRVAYPSAASCVGYTIVDELQAFDWSCNDAAGPSNVYFYTFGLKKTKGLADLVTASAWRNNRVVVSQAGAPVAASARGAWWANVVEAIPASPNVGSPVSLSDSKIYTVSTTVTSLGGYRILFNSKEWAVVTLPGGKLMTDPSLSFGTLLFDGTASALFLWFEGDFQGGTTDTHFADTIGKHSVLRRARLSHFGHGFGDGNQPSESSWISQVRSSDNLYSGLRVKGSFNTYQDITAVSNVGDGVEIGDVAHDNIFVSILAANNGAEGLDGAFCDRNTFIAVTAANNGGTGIDFLGDDYMDLINVVTRNNAGGGYFFSSITESTFAQNVVESIGISASTNLKFSGMLVMSAATLACSVGGGTNPGLVNGTCANQGTSNKTLLHSNGFGDTSFMGAVTADDLSNTSDILGVAPYAAALDWTQFENPFRAWGKTGTFLTAAMRGVCASGSCQIWDYRLSPSSTQLKNTTGNAITQNAAFVDGMPCPSAVDGNVVTIDRRLASRTFLTNAYEAFGTGGNNNGVCESFETCIYMPNYGADQGSGNFRAKKCTFTGGTILGVTMFGY